MDTVLQHVTIEPLGSTLTVAAAAGDSQVTVEWTVDFGVEGTFVLGGVAYDYDGVDPDTGVLTLSEDTIQTAAAVGDEVRVQTATAEESEEWKAWVIIDDADQPEPAGIPGQLRRYYLEGDAQAGAIVPVESNDFGEYVVDGVPGASASETDLGIPAGAIANILGTQVLDDGVTAPGTAPRMGATWTDDPAQNYTLMVDGSGDPIDLGAATYRSLFDDTTQWVTTLSLFGGSVAFVDKTTGLTTYLVSPLPGSFSPSGGVVKIGSTWYVLGSDAARGGAWYVYIFNSSWVKTGEWLFTPLGTGPMPPTMCLNGANLMIVYWTTAGVSTTRVLASTFTPSTGVQVGSSILCDDAGPKTALTGAYYGSADFGSNHLVVVSEFYMRVFSVAGTTGTRQTSKEWTRPYGEKQQGLAWDGTRFHQLGDATSVIWHLGRLVTQATRVGRSTLYDSNATGGTHETDGSAATTFIQKPRTWFVMDVDPPLYGGGQDDPDSVRHYIDDHLQPDLPAGATKVVYDLPGTGGVPVPLTNGFAGVSAPGELISAATDAIGRIIRLLGSGKPGRTGPLSWGSDGFRLEQAVLGAQDNASHTTTAHTLGWVYPTTIAQCTFVAPASGAVRVRCSAYLRANAAGDELAICPEVRAGGTIRSGTVIYSADTLDAFHNRNAQVVRNHSEIRVTGLTPGATYNAYMGVWNATAGSLVNNTRLRVIPDL